MSRHLETRKKVFLSTYAPKVMTPTMTVFGQLEAVPRSIAVVPKTCSTRAHTQKHTRT